MDTKTLPALWQLICVWIIQVYGFSPERSRRNVPEFDISQVKQLHCFNSLCLCVCVSLCFSLSLCFCLCLSVSLCLFFLLFFRDLKKSVHGSCGGVISPPPFYFIFRKYNKKITQEIRGLCLLLIFYYTYIHILFYLYLLLLCLLLSLSVCLPVPWFSCWASMMWGKPWQ